MESTKTTSSDGTIVYRNENGKLHREDGPAAIYPNGSKAWYINGQFHREDGPAIIRSDGYQAWYIKDKRHREDGPAWIRPNGTEAYYVNGKGYTYKEWLYLTSIAYKWRKFCETV